MPRGGRSPGAGRKKPVARLRLGVQLAWTALTNGYAAGFAGGRIFTGASKQLCVPGLNCYSCPGALGACPLGALQAVVGARQFQFAFYVAGFFLVTGAVLGRFVCGFLCPMGLLQDLLYRLPRPKALGRKKLLPGDRALQWVRYVLLVLFCLLLPMALVDVVGQGSPWFCEFVCPSGTLMGSVPLLAANPALRSALGPLWVWKMALAVVLCLLAVVYYRPFCRCLCPLGAVYGLFNPVSLYGIRLDEAACIRCGKCRQACGFDIPVYLRPNSPLCIRCGKCVDACPTGALAMGFSLHRAPTRYDLPGPPPSGPRQAADGPARGA